MAKSLLFGVLGGMGPQATLDLLQKLIDHMPAATDQQHLPVVTWNVPQIPDRQLALAGQGVSPLPQLLSAIAELNKLPLNYILLPCNTAHHWYAELATASRVPILHLVDVAISYIADLSPRPQRVGVIATAATIQAAWYQQGLATLGIEPLVPTQHELNTLFVPGCYAVKRGEFQQAGALLQSLGEALIARGAERLLLACTEVPIALSAIESSLQVISIDPAEVLAKHCVHLWQQQLAAKNFD